MHKLDIKFSMGNKVLLLTKHLNVTGDMKLGTRFVGPFSIIQWVGLWFTS